MELINGKGDFNAAGLDEFVQKTELSKCGLSYAVVAIMGPQSSGKSTLLNHMFHTNFKEMDASQGRYKTTIGIWMEKCASVKEPFIVAMDLEGTDGSERGEDDTAFERQSALFALVKADILIINMWAHDVGRVHAANKPLLRTVFQVMMKICRARKTTLLFVLRDKTKTPLELLEPKLRKEVDEIWNSVHKPTSLTDTPLSEFFNVEVAALSSYEQNEEEFKKEVAKLRQRLLDLLISRGLAGDRQNVVPASGFSISAEKMWKSIKESKDLDLLSHKVLVATICCEKIVYEKLYQLSSNEDWLALEQAIQSGRPASISNFGSELSSILETSFGEYDREALHFDEGVRNEKRKLLVSKTLDLVHPLHLKLLEHLCIKALKNFKSSLEHMLNEGKGFAQSANDCRNSVLDEFDNTYADAVKPIKHVTNVNWDTPKAREKLLQDIDSSKWKAEYEQGLNKALAKRVESLFENPDQDTWAEIRELLTTQTDIATSKMLDRISGLELLEGEKRKRMTQDLRDYARNVVGIKAKEKAEMVLQAMTSRFAAALNEATERKMNTERSIKHACAEALKHLSVMAAMRLDEKQDEIEKILFSSLLGKSASSKTLTSTSEWPEVSTENTLITPAKCNSLWEEFQEKIVAPTKAFIIQQQGGRKGRFMALAKTALRAAGVAVAIISIIVSPQGDPCVLAFS